MESAKLIIEVVAGVVPEQPEPQFTKRWVITSREWEEAFGKLQKTASQSPDEPLDGLSPQSMLLCERHGMAQAYAAHLMMHPSRFNWVRTDWVWL